MRILTKYADSESESLANQLRRKRFALFLELVERLPRPLKILDVGGTENFWERMGFIEQADVEITALNLTAAPSHHPRFTSVAGDARAMPQFADKEFDIVFSNSVIEHVGTFDDQKRMAAEVHRIGKSYFVQTPNKYFPIEPHFLFPLFQFLPVGLKTFLVRNFNLGWYKKEPDKQKARQIATEIRLLTEREVRRLFPNGVIYKEKFKGLTKSFIVYGGF